jgi:hypothetical protein
VPSSPNPAPEAEGLESLLVVCADGGVYKVAIDPVNGGEGTVQWFARCVRGTGRWGGVDDKEFFENLDNLKGKLSITSTEVPPESIYPNVEERILPVEAVAAKHVPSPPRAPRAAGPVGGDLLGAAFSDDLDAGQRRPREKDMTASTPALQRTKTKETSMAKSLIVPATEDWETDMYT